MPARPVARVAPVMVRRRTAVGRAHGFIDLPMNWAVADGVGYLEWTRNVRDRSIGAPRISGNHGTAPAYGRGLRAYLAAVSN